MLIRDDSYFKWIVIYVLLMSCCVFVLIRISPDWDPGVGILRGARELTEKES